MAKLFPLDVGMGSLRGILKVIQENHGYMDLATLAEESEKDVDSLLPLIEACDMLGFTETSESKIKLTKEGQSLNMRNASKVIKAKLEEIEPFKSSVTLLADKDMKSEELFTALNSVGFVFHGERYKNDEILKKLFLTWGVRTKLLRYDPKEDTWSTPK